MPIAEARAQGATALFGEKYGDVVRVVNMGGYSVELCGGTHLDNTAKAGSFRIMSEFSVASGVRRIEAITGKETIAVMSANQQRILNLAAALKVNNLAELEAKAESYVNEIKEMKRIIDVFKAKEAVSEAEQFLVGAKEVSGVKVVTASIGSAGADKLRQLGDYLRDKDANIVAVLAAVNDDKITFLASCGKNAIAQGVKAGDIIKHVTKLCGGSGGGKPDSAMGGGKDVLKLDDALAAVDDFVASKLG